jgi:pyruvate-ferredoxin/flavodoxin oxidoreductase
MTGKASESTPKYPGTPIAEDGSTTVVFVETAVSDAAGAYPITPSTQMGEGWALAVAGGQTNVNGRRLLFFEPEGEHAAAAVTAGMSMTGLRATNFSSGQGVAYMHESLYAAAGKRLTYVLNVAARAMTKHALNVHSGHDDYHAIDDTGFFQVFGKNVQSVTDLTAISHRIAELALTPGVCAQDGFLTSHVIESILLPERELLKEYLGDPADIIDTPTAAQRLTFGPKRRRIPEMYDFDYPAILGPVQNQESYAQGVAAQRPYYFDHIAELADQAMREYGDLTGRRYARAMGYKMDDAEYVIAGQGSVARNAEAVADYLRETRGLKVGALDLVMFRPFPADLITKLLRGKKAVAVLERVDQPLAVDAPLLREIRAAMTKGLENGRAKGALPYPTLATIAPNEIPDFYSGGFGFGSRDLQPADIIAAVDNMLEAGEHRRQFYLGFDFIKPEIGLAQVDSWQQEILKEYPHVAGLSLKRTDSPSLLAKGSISLRMHSVGGWGAITTGKNLVHTVFELLGLNVQANPKYGSEKKGQPTTFFATLSPEPIRSNSELKLVDVVLSPDPNVFRHSDPLDGLAEGGAFVIQSELEPAELWNSLPPIAQATIRRRNIKVYTVDGFRIAQDEASDQELRYRMQGAAFMGAFFYTSPLLEREGLDRDRLFEGIGEQLKKKFGHLGERVVEDNLRVIRRGFDETRAVPVLAEGDALPVFAGSPSAQATKRMPLALNVPRAKQGTGNPIRFFEQVCATANDPIADPFAAISAIPAATSVVRDMTNIRFEVPDFIAEKCTGCAQCWTQCPDAAIPGLVSSVEDIIDTAVRTAGNGQALAVVGSVASDLVKATRKVLQDTPFTTFGDVLTVAYRNVSDGLSWDANRKRALDVEFEAVHAVLADFPLAKTTPFFTIHERREAGSGGLLSITVNPTACKGCNVCVEVCPENALVTTRQDDAIVDRLRKNWDFWEELPDTDDSFINISNLKEGIGVLPTLLLKKDAYRSMLGGDGACMGCGEKTSIHLVTSTVEALMQPAVAQFVAKLEGLIERLKARQRELLATGADLDAAADGATLALSVDPANQDEMRRLTGIRKVIEDLHWRYVEGPGGRGRANLGIANSTGCSSVWASTYPYNPYPYPWVNHLFQDAPSVAIGVFEGQMRKMADAFAAVRRADLYLDGSYNPAKHEAFFEAFDWHQFDDEEFSLCPPILTIGGDGAMFDIGFQNLSRLLASGKPIRVIILDTQVYSNTGGQACTSGFIGQVSDMAAYGKARHGKEETRKEIAMIAMAHRGAFVAQTSQAVPAHLIHSVLRALQTRRPAIVNIYTPCPVEHGLADDEAPHAAKYALESRAFPYMVYDPDAGSTYAECLDLSGNPSQHETWPTYHLEYLDADGAEQRLEVPLTIADWAATEGRFRRHFRDLPADTADDAVLPFHEYVAASELERGGKTPFIYTIDANRHLQRLAVSEEIVDLAVDRLLLWSQLRQMAGHEVSQEARRIVTSELEEKFELEAAQLTADYEAKLANLRATYPQLVARRLAEGLFRTDGKGPMSWTPASVPAAPAPVAASVATATITATAPAAAQKNGASAAVSEPSIESELCTSCDECTNLNKRMFAYNAEKQAYIKDPRAGTYKELVTAAERCTARIISPGLPLDPKEPGLDKWIERAKPYN